MEKFLENLKKYRKEKNFTQAQLAIKINVSREWYNRLEKNEIVPSLIHIQNIAVALKISLAKLLEGSDLLNEFSELNKLKIPHYDNETLYIKRLQDKDDIIASKNELIVSLQNQILELKKINKKTKTIYGIQKIR
jgi:transcriptional regulator with XRE-family HTH domain